MPTTIRDIARVLQVSHTTVSRVLNGRGAEFISEDTRQRVYQTAREMNYRPNRAARALVTGRTGAIALWIGDPVYPYFGSVLHHVEMLLNRQEMDMVYVPIGHVARYMSSRTAVDGVLALDWGETVEEYIAQTSSALPLVNMGVYPSPCVDTVLVDLAAGTREAILHLVASGRRRIGFVSAGRGKNADDGRRAAYQAVMEEAGLPTFFLDLRDDSQRNTRQLSRETVAQHFRSEAVRPDALFCFSDDVMIGIYRGLRDVGQRIPEDVALIGCDGIEDLAYFDPPLSTIAQPYAEMCEAAWGLLQRRISSPESPLEHIVLKPRLILRESSPGDSY